MSKALNDLIKRCEEAQLQYTLITSDDRKEIGEPSGLYITCPNGGNGSKLAVQNKFAETLLEVPFEKWRPMSGYKALWSPELGKIECELHHAASPDSDFYVFEIEGEADGRETLEELAHEMRPRSPREILEELGHEMRPGSPFNETKFTAEGGLSVSIGPAGEFHRMLYWVSDDTMAAVSPLMRTAMTRSPEEALEREEEGEQLLPLTLRIEGADLSSHDDACEILEKVGNSLLFGIDYLVDLPLVLARTRDTKKWRPGGILREEANIWGELLPHISHEYDLAPMSLYWYARGTSELPHLRFLVFYQILEYYVPFYSRRRVLGTLRDRLKDLDLDRDADLEQLLRLEEFKTNSGGRGFGKEAWQLQVTIEECVSPEDLREFLNSDEKRRRFYTSDEAQEVVKEELRINNIAKIQATVAERIHAIRNRIVHAKEGGEAHAEPLFLFDSAVAHFEHDIDLMSFLARKTLVFSSRLLRL